MFTNSQPRDVSIKPETRVAQQFRKKPFSIFAAFLFAITLVVSVESIHAQTITTGTVPTNINTGATFSTPLSSTGTYLNFTSVFSVYLSDPTGSFATKTLLGSTTYFGSAPTSISSTIPCTVPSGTLYRIRVECNNPLVIGSDNGSDIAVNGGIHLTTNNAPIPWCLGQSSAITFVVTCGPFNAGNVFTAELSDPSGNFPGTTIGSLTGTTSGTIPITIPAGTTIGNTYRIRVNSSNPAMNGTLNGNGNLIVSPITITTSTVATPFCQGNAVSVPYSVCGGMVAGNIFTAQLSDANGNFTGGQLNIGSLASTTSGTINATIPLATTPSSLYRIRVVSSNPVVTGSLNTNGALTVNPISITTGAVNSIFCQGNTIFIPYTRCGGFSTGNVFTAQLSDVNGNFTGGETNIGTLTSVNNGNISAVIPASATPGNLYCIRVISSNPNVVGSLNTTGNLTLNPFTMTVGSLNTIYCPGNQIVVPFTVCGGFTTGNVFTAQLSDAYGNFTGGQQTLGTLTGINGGNIIGTIPPATPAGSLYRIRIVSSTPYVVGGVNGFDIIINPLTNLSGTSFLNTGTAYAPLSGNTNVPVAIGDLNDGISDIVDIGFTFNFGNTNYTQFKMSTNGFITFDLTSTATNLYNPIAATSSTLVIAGFASNLILSGTKPMSFKLTGTAPNRILKLQWQNITHTPNAPGSGALTAGEFQIWLYETTNVYEVIYGTFATTAIANFGSYAQVGWKGKCPTDGKGVYKSSYPYWDSPYPTNYLTSMSFGSSGGFMFLPYPGQMFRFTPPAILPIELVEFSGEQQDDHILLEWTTASELNNDHFEIEHSIDGYEFKSIGTIAGAGTATNAHHYALTDHDWNAGTNYYRLKQIDFDGLFSYSNIVAVTVDDEGQFNVTIYPNPARDILTCEIVSPRVANYDMQIIDLTGSVVTKRFIENVKGNSVQTFDIVDLRSGVYILQVTNNQRNAQLEFGKL